MKRIVAIYRKLEQGVTEPLLCGSQDGEMYVVKTGRATADALVCEWLAASLARTVGLPVPDFEVVTCAAEVASESLVDGADWLGRAPGFGSHWVKDCVQLPPVGLEQVPAELRAKVLFFDHWICNRDR